MKKWIVVITALALLLSLGACAKDPVQETLDNASESTSQIQEADDATVDESQTDEDVSATENEFEALLGEKVVASQPYRMAFVVKNQTNEFFIRVADSMQKVCQAYGVELTVQATENESDIDEQLQICDTFLTQGYDAIFVTPLSSTAIVPFVKECNDVGVPIIIVDTAADADALEAAGAHMDYFVTCDNIDAGNKMATAMIDALDGEGNIIVLEGTAGSYTGITLLEGVMDVLETSNIHVVASQAANFNRVMGYEVTQTLLVSQPDIDGILALNDEMALGAIQALEEAGIEDVAVTGLNNASGAQEAILAGDMYATVEKGADIQGVYAVLRAIQLLEGDEIPEEEYLPCEIVTADSLR